MFRAAARRLNSRSSASPRGRPPAPAAPAPPRSSPPRRACSGGSAARQEGQIRASVRVAAVQVVHQCLGCRWCQTPAAAFAPTIQLITHPTQRPHRQQRQRLRRAEARGGQPRGGRRARCCSCCSRFVAGMARALPTIALRVGSGGAPAAAAGAARRARGRGGAAVGPLAHAAGIKQHPLQDKSARVGQNCEQALCWTGAGQGCPSPACLLIYSGRSAR